ncbi:MAG: acylneuraminate cytidylyltransferase [Pseudobdellovibrionaceae bacterium]
MPKVGIISQARMTSTRLPGKVLKPIGAQTLLDYHLDRLLTAQAPLLVATTELSSDQPIVDLCEKRKIPSFRGDENDVLSRFFLATVQQGFEIIVRVTSDCPLIDGYLIKDSIALYQKLNTPWLYLSNCIERTYARGFDFEIFSFEMLEEAHRLAQSPVEREHVTPYFYQNQHGKTKFHHIKRNPSASQFRLTVDEAADFELIKKLILDFKAHELNEATITEILLKHPELARINSSIEQKKL